MFNLPYTRSKAVSDRRILPITSQGHIRRKAAVPEWGDPARA